MNIRDLTTTMDPRVAVRAGYNVASQVSDQPVPEQLVGAAVFLMVAADILKLDVRAMLNQAERMTGDADTFFQREAKALRDYIKWELS